MRENNQNQSNLLLS